MSVQELIHAHPRGVPVDAAALARCVEACFDCAATCSACADACLGESGVDELVRCIRLDLDCADVCIAAGRVLARQTELDPQQARTILVACAQACRLCAEECERHASHRDHCRVCAEACRRCEASCNELVTVVR